MKPAWIFDTRLIVKSEKIKDTDLNFWLRKWDRNLVFIVNKF